MENTIFLFSCLDEKQRDLFVVLPEILICSDMRKLFDKVTRLRILDRKIFSLDRKTACHSAPSGAPRYAGDRRRARWNRSRARP